MATILPLTSNSSMIDLSSLVNSRRKLADGVILPSTQEDIEEISVVDHTSEPIKNLEDIDRVQSYLIENERYRDNMLFIVGINFGLRVSDLLRLRFTHLIDSNSEFRTVFPILEKKTSNTRSTKQNRYITINDAVIDAVTLYLQNNKCSLDDFLFKNEASNASKENRAMDRKSVDRILKGIAEDLHLNYKVSTHTLRKTFGYHQMVMSGNDPRKLMLLQKIFGHSSSMQTLQYIGITKEEIQDAYMKLNLGGRNHYLIDSKIGERVS